MGSGAPHEEKDLEKRGHAIHFPDCFRECAPVLSRFQHSTRHARAAKLTAPPPQPSWGSNSCKQHPLLRHRGTRGAPPQLRPAHHRTRSAQLTAGGPGHPRGLLHLIEAHRPILELPLLDASPPDTRKDALGPGTVSGVESQWYAQPPQRSKGYFTGATEVKRKLREVNMTVNRTRYCGI